MSHASQPLMVADASIALKWFLTDELYAGEAGLILEAFRRGRTRLIAPDHVRCEIANSLRVAHRANRMTDDWATRSLVEFLSLRIPRVASDSLLTAGFEYAARFGCAVYDALYLALADMAQCPLVHADRRLLNTLGGRLERELRIADYPPAET